MFIDTHCHLTDRHCNDGDADRAIANAMAAGVGMMICPTADPDDIPGALQIAHTHANVFCTIGIHPEYISANPDDLLTDDILNDPRVVGRIVFKRQINRVYNLRRFFTRCCRVV